MKKIALTIAFVVLAVVPVSAEEKPRTTEQTQRRQPSVTPYSTSEREAQRTIRDAIREAKQERRGVYRFRRARERDPQN